MKLLYLALTLFATATLYADGAQITWLETTTKDDSPGIEVQFYSYESESMVYRVHIEYETESGRTMKMSRLVENPMPRQSQIALLSVVFETGVAKVKKVTVSEMAVSKEHTRTN